MRQTAEEIHIAHIIVHKDETNSLIDIFSSVEYRNKHLCPIFHEIFVEDILSGVVMF